MQNLLQVNSFAINLKNVQINSKNNILSHINNSKISFREATVAEDSIIAEHFYQLWLDNGIPQDGIVSNWLETTLKFIEFARVELHYRAFIAETTNQIVGSASCQLFSGLYPHVLSSDYRRYGYIWGVYVQSEFRRKGIGKHLSYLATCYLQSLGCTRAVLNASPYGKSVYASLGFVDSNLMQLDFPPNQDCYLPN